MDQLAQVPAKGKSTTQLPAVDYNARYRTFVGSDFAPIKAEALRLAKGDDEKLSSGVRIDNAESLSRIRTLLGAGRESGTHAVVSRNPIFPEPGGKSSETWTIRLMSENGDKFGKCQFDAATKQLGHLNNAAAYTATNSAEQALEPVIKKHGAALDAALKTSPVKLNAAVLTELKTAFGVAEKDRIEIRPGEAFTFGRTGGLVDEAYQFDVYAIKGGKPVQLAHVAVEMGKDRPIVTLHGQGSVRAVAP